MGVTKDPFFLGKADKLHVGVALLYLPRPGWEHSHSPAGQASDTVYVVPRPPHTHTCGMHRDFIRKPHGVWSSRKGLHQADSAPRPGRHWVGFSKLKGHAIPFLIWGPWMTPSTTGNWITGAP